MLKTTRYVRVGLFAVLAGCSVDPVKLGDGAAGGSAVGGATVQPSGGSLSNPATGGTVAMVSTGGAVTTVPTGGTAPISPSGGRDAVAGAPSTGSGGKDGTIRCANIENGASATPVVLELVIDNSGSFEEDAYPSDPDNDATKWAEVRRVLPEALRTLPSTWAVGTTYYNLTGSTSDPSTCYVGHQAAPIAQLTEEHLQDLIDTVPGEATGATPTFSAWRFGLQQLTQWQRPPGYEASPRYLLVLTDGVPTVKNNGCYGSITCGDPPPDWEPPTPLCVPGEVVISNGRSGISETEYDRFLGAMRAEGQAAGIRTFVVDVLGVQDSQGQGYDSLYKQSQMAEVGGTADPDCVSAPGTVEVVSSFESTLVTRGTYCHLDTTTDPDFANGLLRALKEIVTSLVTCTYAVPTAIDYPIDYEYGTEVSYYPGGSDPIDPSSVVVLKQNESGETDPTCPGMDAGTGWYYSKHNEFGEPTELRLCPGSCETVRADLDAQVKVSFKCIIVE